MICSKIQNVVNLHQISCAPIYSKKLQNTIEIFRKGIEDALGCPVTACAFDDMPSIFYYVIFHTW